MTEKIILICSALVYLLWQSLVESQSDQELLLFSCSVKLFWNGEACFLKNDVEDFGAVNFYGVIYMYVSDFCYKSN